MDRSNQEPESQSSVDTESHARDLGFDSVALARLLEEVRNDTSFNPAAYNRTYNRHNR